MGAFYVNKTLFSFLVRKRRATVLEEIAKRVSRKNGIAVKEVTVKKRLGTVGVHCLNAYGNRRKAKDLDRAVVGAFSRLFPLLDLGDEIKIDLQLAPRREENMMAYIIAMGEDRVKIVFGVVAVDPGQNVGVLALQAAKHLDRIDLSFGLYDQLGRGTGKKDREKKAALSL